jgi:hypothetical protein
MLLTYEGKMTREIKQETLLDQSQIKFSQLPSEIPQRVFAIDRIEEVDGFLQKIITANSLEEMGLNNHHNKNAE